MRWFKEDLYLPFGFTDAFDKISDDFDLACREVNDE